MIRLFAPALLAVLAALAGACADISLPEGWSGAEELSVRQSACLAMHPGEHELVELDTQVGSARITYLNAPFRCEQEVTAFLKRDGSLLEVLFQPKNVEPSSVARCDCRYTLETSFDAPAGGITVNIWRRGDAYGLKDASASAPVFVDTVQAEVPKD